MYRSSVCTVPDSWPYDRGFESHRRHDFMSLSETVYDQLSIGPTLEHVPTRIKRKTVYRDVTKLKPLIMESVDFIYMYKYAIKIKAK